MLIESAGTPAPPTAALEAIPTEAKAADPGITVLNGYSEDFGDQAKCKQIALNQIERGAGVIFQVAGGCGLGALDAAREKGVWGIGVDADQSFLGPHILTSAVKRVDTAVFLAIKSVVDGTFKGGNIVFGLKENGVDIEGWGWSDQVAMQRQELIVTQLAKAGVRVKLALVAPGPAMSSFMIEKKGSFLISPTRRDAIARSTSRVPSAT